MATKAPQLSILKLADVLAALTEVTKPYELGIQLEIDLAVLDTIEKDHPKDIGRQKTEVIKYWLRNSRDTSWTTLANAVEKMGGHSKLVERLREKEQSSERSSEPRLHKPEFSFCVPHVKSSAKESEESDDDIKVDPTEISVGICRETCEDRDVLLLGKMGHGKSTLGNKMLNYDGCLKINNRKRPQICQGSSSLWSASQRKNYEVTVYDHDGLFEGAISVEDLSSEIPLDLNLVVFVLKQGRSFDVHEREILEAVITKYKIGRISSLVITHCENLSEEEREEIIEQFKKDHPSVAKLMGKGILAVGFPDSSHIQPGSQLSQRVEDDKKKLRQLIYSCDAIVYK